MKTEITISAYLDSSGRLTAFPAKRKLKFACLQYLAEKFEPGRSYTEKEVNTILLDACTFEDPETLRREMCGYRFMQRNRDGSDYRLLPEVPVFPE